MFGTRFILLCGALVCAVPASAQIKPESSGQPSFLEPEMRRHGEGLYRPRMPHRNGYRRGHYGMRRF